MAIAESLDHFVVPVDDIVVAEEFYVRVFGGVITKRNGLNVRSSALYTLKKANAVMRFDTPNRRALRTGFTDKEG
jgi:hypothetical protein